jgi:hypothetical protein
MPNPPYSGLVLIARDTQDGITFRVWTWEELVADNLVDAVNGQVVGLEVPPSPIGFAQSLTQANPPPTRHRAQSVATRGAAVTRFQQLVNLVFPDIPA